MLYVFSDVQVLAAVVTLETDIHTILHKTPWFEALLGPPCPWTAYQDHWP